MTIIYRTDDGKEFTNRVEAEQHEYQLKMAQAKVLMFCGDGGLTEDTEKAMVVYLENDLAYSRFKDLCKEQDDDMIQGIEDCGLYVWSYDTERYEEISSFSLKALKAYFAYEEKEANQK